MVSEEPNSSLPVPTRKLLRKQSSLSKQAFHPGVWWEDERQST